MQKVFTDNSIVRCDFMRSILESNNIECLMKNETTSAMFGGGAGNLYRAVPEIWVNDEDYTHAKEIIAMEENGT